VLGSSVSNPFSVSNPLKPSIGSSRFSDIGTSVSSRFFGFAATGLKADPSPSLFLCLCSFLFLLFSSVLKGSNADTLLLRDRLGTKLGISLDVADTRLGFKVGARINEGIVDRDPRLGSKEGTSLLLSVGTIDGGSREKEDGRLLCSQEGISLVYQIAGADDGWLLGGVCEPSHWKQRGPGIPSQKGSFFSGQPVAVNMFVTIAFGGRFLAQTHKFSEKLSARANMRSASISEETFQCFSPDPSNGVRTNINFASVTF
jgi:hypothetical protein